MSLKEGDYVLLRDDCMYVLKYVLKGVGGNPLGMLGQVVEVGAPDYRVLWCDGRPNAYTKNCLLKVNVPVGLMRNEGD